ncbi:MAG: transposase [Vicinamibacterales bacterium]
MLRTYHILAVRDWLAQNAARIRLLFLPACSPELNPDQYLNQDVKSNSVGRRRARNADELIADVRGYLRGTQRQPAIVERYFHARPVRYAAAT